MRKPVRNALASGKVRYVGDPVAMVVARTAGQARDAAEAVALDLEALPAVPPPRRRWRPGRPSSSTTCPATDRRLSFRRCREGRGAFAQAAHVTKLRIVNNRVVVNPIEPRAAIGVYDARSKRYTLHAPSQGAFGLRNSLAAAMGVGPSGCGC